MLRKGSHAEHEEEHDMAEMGKLRNCSDGWGDGSPNGAGAKAKLSGAARPGADARVGEGMRIDRR